LASSSGPAYALAPGKQGSATSAIATQDCLSFRIIIGVPF
jgi:hypothetical protein